MSKRILSSGLVAWAMLLPSCNSARIPIESDGEKPSSSRLGDTIDLSLSDLLAKPRAELAAMAEECITKIQIQEKARREGKLGFALLPDFRLPLVVPVLREATFSVRAGFSLPPYGAEAATDTELALHLARYGDSEAASKLAPSTDVEALKQIETSRLERVYPVEWTRLVGLLLHAAQLRLATGDVDGGTEIVALHRQLAALLGPKATKSALGAELLARGRGALARAATAWRAEKKLELAAQADAAAAAWGDVPPLELRFRPGTPRTQVTQLVNSAGRERALSAPSVARVLDLFALPFPADGAEGSILFFDDADRLSDILITYRSDFAKQFPEPANLAHLLEERPMQGEDGAKSPGLRVRNYQAGKACCAVSVVAHGAGVGALVHVSGGAEGRHIPRLSRDFGPFHLDRSFEQNRLRVAPDKRAESITVDQPRPLAQLANPIPKLKPKQATLVPQGDHLLTAKFIVQYSVEESGPPALHRLALPLFVASGPPQFRGVADPTGGHLALAWEDARTRHTLRLPYENGQPVQFEALDRQRPEQLAEREAAATSFDREERRARIEAGKPLTRLSRHLEQLELGFKRSQALRLLPSGQAVFKRDMPGGLTVAFNGEPDRTNKYVLRQLFIRCDEADRVVELRARYIDGPAAGANAVWMTEMLNSLKKRGGVPVEPPAPWARLWPDLPPLKPAPLLCLWQDDVTTLTYQRDNGGVELVVRDCSLEHEAGVPLPGLEYLPRGPVDCTLGVDREELLQKLGGSPPPKTEDGALVLRPSAPSPYDAVLAWFDKDKAVRIVARHAQNTGKSAGAAPPGQAITEAWGREFRTLGWPRRQDLGPNDALQGLSWHDDRTRVRIFSQENDNGSIRLFTEWQEIPKVRNGLENGDR